MIHGDEAGDLRVRQDLERLVSSGEIERTDLTFHRIAGSQPTPGLASTPATTLSIWLRVRTGRGIGSLSDPHSYYPIPAPRQL
jgi:hypothetical protein